MLCVTTPTVVVIDVVKSVGIPSLISKGVYEIPYVVLVGNSGPSVYNVQTNDNLSATFPAPTVFTVKAGSYGVTSIAGTCTGNVAFNGSTDTRLLSGTDDFGPGHACEIRFVVNVNFGAQPLPAAIYNNALASAMGVDSPTANVGFTGIGQNPTTGVITTAVPPVGVVASDFSVHDATATPTGSQAGTPPYRPKLPASPNGDSVSGIPTPLVLSDVDDGALLIRKTTVTKVATAGDVVEYTINVTNTSTNPTNVKVTDVPPTGFIYVPRSVKVNNAVSGDAIASGGGLIFDIGTIPAKSSIELRYQMKLGDEVVGGEATNCVSASGTNSATGTAKDSAQSCATVIVETGLFLEKRVNVNRAELGDSVEYSLRVKSIGGRTNNVKITDNMPLGFKLISGTVKIIRAGITKAMADPAGAPGPVTVYSLGTVANNEVVEIRYRARLGVGSDLGDGINRAQAKAPYARSSLIATAKVEVTRGIFNREVCIAGKVFVDCNQNDGEDKGERNGVQDKGELGIPGVRLYMEDGTSITTDVNGQYSICGIRAISHIMQVDTTTMPAGSRMGITSNRNLGDGISLLMNPKAGELYRADFAESTCKPAILDEVKERIKTGVVKLPMTISPSKPVAFDSSQQPGYSRPFLCTTNPNSLECRNAGGVK